MTNFIFFILSFAPTSFASNQVLTYEPSVVELIGILDMQTFPGPPNFESIKDGDETERHFYLRLNHPINVFPSGKHTIANDDEKERNVKILQLAIGDENEALWAKFHQVERGGRVSIRGSLFHRVTGHHHTRVLLSVEKMEKL